MRELCLEPAGTLASFLERPLGRWFAGPSFVYWYADPTLFGFSLWGRPSKADVALLASALVVELGPQIAPHCSLVDCALLASADPQAFEVLQQYVGQHHARLQQQVTRLSLVRPDGMVGAVVSGFYQVLDPPYPTQAFPELEPALQWLGAAPGWAPVLRALRSELSGVAPLLTQLRGVLQQLGASPQLGAVARLLALSQRTLQRRLTGLGTSYAQEVNRHRMNTAQRLMLESDAPLTAIAIDSGFSSLQHFSAAFRKATGSSPSLWRQRAANAQPG